MTPDTPKPPAPSPLDARTLLAVLEHLRRIEDGKGVHYEGMWDELEQWLEDVHELSEHHATQPAPSPASAETLEQRWLPRESAPVDGSVFRAYGPVLVHPDFNPWGQVEACFSGEEFIGAVWDGQHDQWNTVSIEFTHWQPFPPSPAETGRCQ